MFAPAAAASASARTATRRTEGSGPSAWTGERTFILAPQGERYDQKFKDQVVAAYQDRLRIRGITRPFGVCYQPSCGGWGKKRALSRPLWTRSDRARTATGLHLMNSGASWAAKPASFGSGWCFVEERAKSSAGRRATGACKARRTGGPLCPRATGAAPRAATTGTLPRQSARAEPTGLVASPRARPATWSVGLARCGQGPAAWCAAPTLSRRTPSTTSTPSIGSSPTPTSLFSRKQRSGDHYPRLNMAAAQRRQCSFLDKSVFRRFSCSCRAIFGSIPTRERVTRVAP